MVSLGIWDQNIGNDWGPYGNGVGPHGLGVTALELEVRKGRKVRRRINSTQVCVIPFALGTGTYTCGSWPKLLFPKRKTIFQRDPHHNANHNIGTRITTI